MRNLLIAHPPSCKEERHYIFRVLFEEFLGLSYECYEVPGDVVQVRLADAPETGTLLWPDIFFYKYSAERLITASLPNEPLSAWNVGRDLPEAKVLKPIIPVIYGKPLGDGTWFEHKVKTIRLGLDIGGSAFFMLTRYEEAVLPDRDEHGRFPAKASLAYREGFLDRPIIDEYVEILWASMKRLWPELERKQREYQVHLSHDVDNALGAVNKPWLQVLRNIGGDLVKRKDLRLAYRRFMAKYGGNHDTDPLNTFDFIMDMSERYGLTSTFYFKAGYSNSQFDENYALDLPWIQELLYRIHERGHEIGLHPSYEAFKDSARTCAEFKALLQVVERLKIIQERWGGRQHYLRWENPTTWQIYEEAGLDYDSTLGFADHVGFRCGTCHEFPAFNLRTRKTLRLRERPLIVMDGTLLDSQYMALRPEQALEWIERLSNTCRHYGGMFSLLWHNTLLIQSWQKELYLKVLRIILL